MKKQFRIHAGNGAKRIYVLTLFLLLGIVLGFVKAGTLTVDDRAILQAYVFQRAQSLAELSRCGVLETLWTYFRTPVLLALLSYCSVAVVPILCICIARSFILAFTVGSFIQVFGSEGFFLTFGVLIFRCLFMLPAILYLSDAAIKASLESTSEGHVHFWKRAVCAAVYLVLGAILELIVSPLLLQYFFSH